jgi:muconolactone delta-isomerase
MEYLVDMTTRVPDGTPAEAVDDIRSREAAHSHELVAQGHLLRLWRPPLQTGEWRTLGLFAAEDGGQLEEVLASMPLRVWRSDEVTRLAPHPNDPVRQPERPGSPTSKDSDTATQFLTTFTLAVPEGTPVRTVEDNKADEARHTRELAEQGHLLRLWTLPGQGQSLGLWRAQDAAEMQTIIESLPLSDWITVDTTPLTPHPNDPAIITR